MAKTIGGGGHTEDTMKVSPEEEEFTSAWRRGVNLFTVFHLASPC